MGDMWVSFDFLLSSQLVASQFWVPSSEFRVSSSEFRVPSCVFRVPSSEFRVMSSEFRVLIFEFYVLCSVFCVLCSVFCVLCSVFCVLCSVFCVLCSVFCVLCSEFRVLIFEFCVPCSVFRVSCSVFRVPCSVFWVISYRYKLVHYVRTGPPCTCRCCRGRTARSRWPTRLKWSSLPPPAASRLPRRGSGTATPASWPRNATPTRTPLQPSSSGRRTTRPTPDKGTWYRGRRRRSRILIKSSANWLRK